MKIKLVVEFQGKVSKAKEEIVGGAVDALFAQLGDSYTTYRDKDNLKRQLVLDIGGVGPDFNVKISDRVDMSLCIGALNHRIVLDVLLDHLPGSAKLMHFVEAVGVVLGLPIAAASLRVASEDMEKPEPITKYIQPMLAKITEIRTDEKIPVSY